MKVLVIRHGRAGDREDFAETGMSDDLRPLTEDGRSRMRRAARGLHRLVDDIDVLASSPLVRARQTADIIAAEYDAPEVRELEELRPEAPPSALVEWLQQARAKTVAVVGHEPHLSELVGLLLMGRPESIVEIKKGAAVMLEVRDGRGTLLWSLTPRQLRMLGRRS